MKAALFVSKDIVASANLSITWLKQNACHAGQIAQSVHQINNARSACLFTPPSTGNVSLALHFASNAIAIPASSARVGIMYITENVVDVHQDASVASTQTIAKIAWMDFIFISTEIVSNAPINAKTVLPILDV